MSKKQEGGAASPPPKLDTKPKGVIRKKSSRGRSEKPKTKGVLRKKASSSPPPVKLKESVPAASPRAQSDLYTEFINGLYEAILITDNRGYVVDINARAEDLFRGTRLELCRSFVGDIISGLTQSVLEKVAQQLRSGRHTVMDAFCNKMDGTTSPAEIAVSKMRLAGKDMLSFALRDTSVRRKSQKIMKTAHNALQGSPCGMAIVDLSARIEYVNPAFLSMWEHSNPKKVIGAAIDDLWAKDLTENFKGCLVENKPWSTEIARIRESGADQVLQVTAAPNRDHTGQVVGIAISFIDITDLKRAQEEIRKEAQEQLRRHRETDDFSGLINIIAVPDVIQLIDSSKKSGTLELMNRSRKVVSSIAFSFGQIIHATHGDKTGKDAVIAALTSKAESFQFKQGNLPPVDKSITDSTMRILFEGIKALDESSGPFAAEGLEGL